MTPEIKTVTLEHLEIVAALFDAYRVFYQEKSDLERARTFLLERIQNSESVIYLAFEAEKPLASSNDPTRMFPSMSASRRFSLSSRQPRSIL